MTTANLLQLSRAREATQGVAATGPYTKCFVTSEDFKVAPTFETSQTITGERATEEHILTGVEVTAAPGFEHAYGYIDWAQDLLAMNTVRQRPYAAPGEVTDVAANTFTAPGEYLPGMLVQAKDHGPAANNGIFKLGAGSGSGTAVVDGATLTDDASPTGSLRVVGFEAAAGDVVSTASGITTTALDLTTLGVQPGEPVGFSGFTPTKMNTIVKAVFWDANSAGLTDLPGVDREGSPQWLSGETGTIRIWLGDILEHGDTLSTETFQKGFSGMAAAEAAKRLAYLGVTVDQFTLNLQAAQLVSGQATLRGFTGRLENAQIGGAPVEPDVGKIMSAARSISRICEAGSAVGIRNICRTMNLTFGNNLTPITGLGEEGPVGFELGDASVESQSTHKFGSYDIYSRLLNEEQTSFGIPMRRGNHGYYYAVHQVTYTDGNFEATGRNTEVEAQMTGMADKHPTFGKAWTIARFHHIGA